jgi:O-6-methylguanine DNA methyltransferase
VIPISFRPKVEKPAHFNTYSCPSIFGKMSLSLTDDGDLIELHLASDHSFPRPPKNLDPLLDSIEEQNWDKLPQLVAFGTPFQIQVWSALASIPQGTLTTYKELAYKIGCRSGFRAVGQAVGKNPLALIIPCHRVLSTSGSLGGYRWGLDIKKNLLIKEGHRISL